MNAPISREELFELAAKPIGDRAIQQRISAAGGDPFGKIMTPETTQAAKRAQKLWLPHGKQSANTTAAREAERELKALNYDLEDAVEAAGGTRGGPN